MPLPLLMGAAKLAGILSTGAEVFHAAKDAYEHVTGKVTDPDQSPEVLAERIAELPEDQRAEVQMAAINAAVAHDKLYTERFAAMSEGDAEKLRASARPRIALQAMGTIAMWSHGFGLLVVVGLLDWFGRAVYEGWRGETAWWSSPFSLISEVAPVWEMFGAAILGSLWAAVAIVKAYMGARERDKAQEYELRAGRPLKSTEATIAAAGGAVGRIISAFKGSR